MAAVLQYCLGPPQLFCCQSVLCVLKGKTTLSSCPSLELSADKYKKGFSFLSLLLITFLVYRGGKKVTCVTNCDDNYTKRFFFMKETQEFAKKALRHDNNSHQVIDTDIPSVCCRLHWQLHLCPQHIYTRAFKYERASIIPLFTYDVLCLHSHSTNY